MAFLPSGTSNTAELVRAVGDQAGGFFRTARRFSVPLDGMGIHTAVETNGYDATS